MRRGPSQVPRVTARDVDLPFQRLKVLGLNCSIDRQAGGWRLVQTGTSDTSSFIRYLSPRLKTRQFIEWLEAFGAGYVLAQNEYMRRHQVPPVSEP